MLDAKAREALAGLQTFTGRLFSRVGLTANAITVLGIVLSAIGAWRIADGAFLAGGIILAAGGVLDFCDGAVAKYTGTASVGGAFFDSVSDRLSDALVFSALAWYFFGIDDELLGGVVLAGYALSTLTSYLRAKAESLGLDCRVGLMERAERLIVLNAALILGFIEIGLWVIAAGAAFTVGQRFVHVMKQARARA